MGAILSPADQAELDHINSGSSLSPEDQAELDHINSGKPMPVPTSIPDGIHSAISGIGRGVLESPGLIGDLANLAQLGYGKVTGDKDIQDHARAGLAGKNGFDMGTASIGDILDRAGIVDYKPVGDKARNIYDVARMSGAAMTGGLEGLAAKSLVKGTVPSLGRVGAVAGTDATIGAGAGLGAEGGKYLADKAGVENPYGRFAMESIPALVGGKLTGSALNRTALYQAPDIASDFKTAGVDPVRPSDINGGRGDMLDKLFDNVAPKDAIKDQQSRIGDNLAEQLGWQDKPSIQEQGQNIQDTLKKNRDYAEGDLYEPDHTYPSTANGDSGFHAPSEEDMASRHDHLDDLTDKSKPYLNNPIPESIPPSVVRNSDLGASKLQDLLGLMPGSEKQTVRDLMANQLGTGATPDLENAMKFWSNASKEIKETVQSADPQAAQALDRTQRLYDATQNSRDFMNQPSSSTPIKDTMELVKGGGILGGLASGAYHGLTAIPDLGSAFGQTGLTAAVGAGLGFGAKVAAPAAAKGLGFLGQNLPGMTRMSAPVVGNMVDTAPTLLGVGSSLNQIPDTYKPPADPQHAELPTGADVQKWLGSTDRGSATNFVAQRLGPDVAKQLASTDDIGYKSALFNLSSDPNFRKQLASSPLPDAGDETGADTGAGDIPTMTIHPSLDRGIGGTG